MVGTLKTNEVKLVSPNGLQEATMRISNDGVIQEKTLSSSSWTGSSAPYSYALSVNGATTTNINEIFLSTNITSSQLDAFQNANIIDGGQGENYITLKAFGVKPIIDIPIRVLVRGDI